MIDEEITVYVPSYKEAFTFRKVLIELGFRQNAILNLKIWHYIWSKYGSKSAFHIKNNHITYYDSSRHYFNGTLYTVQELIKKYIICY